MIVSSPAPTINATVYLDGVATPLPVSSLSVEQAEFMHDMATVVLSPSDPTNLYRADGAPILIEWGYPGAALTPMFGYVSDIAAMTSSSADPYRTAVQIKAVGATVVMQNSEPATWRNRNVPSVLADIVRGHRLAARVHEHRHVWPILVQGVEVSDWSFLVSMARRIGFSLVSKNVVVQVLDPARVLREQRLAPVFSDTRTGVPNVTSVVSSAGARQRMMRDRRVYYHGAGGASPVSTAVSPRFGSIRPTLPATAVVSPYPATDRATAEAVVDGIARQQSWWYDLALRDAVGNPLVRPGTVIEYSTSNEDLAGRWYVRGASHILSLSGYGLSIQASRDALYSSGLRPGLASEFAHKPVTVDLVGTRWVSRSAT